MTGHLSYVSNVTGWAANGLPFWGVYIDAFLLWAASLRTIQKNTEQKKIQENTSISQVSAFRTFQQCQTLLIITTSFQSIAVSNVSFILQELTVWLEMFMKMTFFFELKVKLTMLIPTAWMRVIPCYRIYIFSKPFNEQN